MAGALRPNLWCLSARCSISAVQNFCCNCFVGVVAAATRLLPTCFRPFVGFHHNLELGRQRRVVTDLPQLNLDCEEVQVVCGVVVEELQCGGVPGGRTQPPNDFLAPTPAA